MSDKEIYLLLVLRCLRKRIEEIHPAQPDHATRTLARSESYLKTEMLRRWDNLTDKVGLPSPMDVKAWL